jgi:hypothetical protein
MYDGKINQFQLRNSNRRKQTNNKIKRNSVEQNFVLF